MNCDVHVVDKIDELILSWTINSINSMFNTKIIANNILHILIIARAGNKNCSVLPEMRYQQAEACCAVSGDVIIFSQTVKPRVHWICLQTTFTKEILDFNVM